jgi:competence protein ComEA
MAQHDGMAIGLALLVVLLAAPPAAAARDASKPTVVAHYVDINSAQREELMRLPGISAADAQKIIAHRPYLTKTELVSKGVLATGPFLALRNLVVAMQPGAHVQQARRTDTQTGTAR